MWTDTLLMVATTAAAPAPAPAGGLLGLLLAPFGENLGLFALFNLFVLGVLALDLGVFQRKGGDPTPRQAGWWCIAWEVLSLTFLAILWYHKGQGPALQFLAGYIIEKSLSVDNLFVFVLVFSYFQVPPKYQRRVLYYGILGALAMRAVLIVLGAALVAKFHWVLYIFGVVLVVTGVRMAIEKEEEMDPAKNPVVKLASRWLPLSKEMHGEKFVVKLNGKRLFTPLFLVLLVVEFTDLVFAVDSIPAAFTVSRDPFILYTSNVFAIMGLRSLYFLLSHAVTQFHYMQLGIAVVLVFVGAKMLIEPWFEITTKASLSVIVLLLGGAIGASLLKNRRDGAKES